MVAERALGTGQTSWRATLALTGPAVVASVAYIDPGNIAINVAAGSHYGYDLLWVVLLANAIAIFVQCLAAKLGIVTGQNLAELSRVYFPRPLAWAMWVCSELVAMATDLAEFTGAAIGFALLLHTSLLAGMVITGCVTCIILALESRGFRPMELAIGGLVAGVALSFLAELLIAPPVWWVAAYHLAIPALPDKGATILAIAIVGATVMPHALYVHSGLTQNRLALHDDQQRLRLLCFSNREVLFALGVASIINLAMVAMAAAVFHDGVHNNLASIEQAYRTLISLLGGGAAVIFMLALIGSGVSSSVVGTMAGQIVMQGFVGFHLPIWLRRAITALPAFVIVSIGMNATHALILSQIVLSLGLPIPMISLLLLTANEKLMGSFANSRFVNTIGAGALVLILALNATLLLQTLGYRV
ncbi:MAG: Nramp family divalent metal transporter [Deltaproteobacteria bacterium]|nr:Nramp family divalent metal transporter [Deltaproteobacteria bacterium]